MYPIATAAARAHACIRTATGAILGAMRRALPVLLLAACPAPDPATGASASAGTTGTTTPASTSGEPPTSSTTFMAGTSSTATTASTGSDTTTDDATSTGGAPAGLRYHEVQQKSAHNSFQRDESLLDQLVYHRIRSLELDIHHSAAFAAEVPGDWYVYHIDVVDDASHCRRLSDCLGLLAAFQRAQPEHEVLTLWLDLKDGFITDHQPADLDARLTDAFGPRLLRPAELLAACPAAATLQQAITLPGCGWPELAALRGRVLVALTGGDLDDPSGPLATYVGDDASSRAAFVAPDLAAAQTLSAHPEALLHNLALADVALAAAVRDAGLVSRVWVVDELADWSAAAQAGAQHLASNKISAAQDLWASTANAGGWPFRCMVDCEEPTREPTAILAADVDSGDLWGDSDEALFAHITAQEVSALTALLSVPSSHVEPWAKACLAARQGLAADAPYLAICRPADGHPLSVQFRPTAGANSKGLELEPLPGLDIEAPAFARLELGPDALCARGLGSPDGVVWTLIAEQCFAAPLTHLGITASSHDAGPLRLLFADLQTTFRGPLVAEDLTVTLLGAAVGDIAPGP